MKALHFFWLSFCMEFILFKLKNCFFSLQKELLKQILKLGSSVPNVISKSVSDQFELCLVKCRTSSKVSKLFSTVF